VKELLDSGTGQFTARVQAHLPTGYTFALALRDGEREVCRHGFMRDGKLHTALSGAEWAIEQVAIASAVAEVWSADAGGATANAQPFVIVPEDRGMSTRALDAVLAAFASCPQQVIVTTPTRPSVTPPGWTVIDADANEHRGSSGDAVAKQAAPLDVKAQLAAFTATAPWK
jgi:hypothetical protein